MADGDHLRSDHLRGDHQRSDHLRGDHWRGADPGAEADSVIIDCDDCAVRGPGCQDCVVSVLLGVPETLLVDEARALEVLAEAGLAPRLRLVPIHRQKNSGVA